ncbi:MULTISPECIES: hypothetical protein, partial [unclassified Streptomyces]
NRDDRGGDRGGFRRDDRPSGGAGGFRAGGAGERPYGRRDDNRPSGSGSTGSSFGGRRDDKPRWKRNG